MSSSAPALGWYRQAQAALWDILRTRQERRAWIACMYACLFGGAAASIGLKTRWDFGSPLSGACIALAALSWLGWILLAWWARLALRAPGPAGAVPAGFGLPPDQPLGARETAVRDRAYRRAYQFVVLLALAASTAAFIFEEELPGLFRALAEDRLILVPLFAVILFLASLPVAFLAWTEPDEDMPIEPAADSAP